MDGVGDLADVASMLMVQMIGELQESIMEA